MIDVINLIERLTGKTATQYDVDWVEALMEREERRIIMAAEGRQPIAYLKCGCALGWCDCNG